jgi:hypothetical protein
MIHQLYTNELAQSKRITDHKTSNWLGLFRSERKVKGTALAEPTTLCHLSMYSSVLNKQWMGHTHARSSVLNKQRSSHYRKLNRPYQQPLDANRSRFVFRVEFEKAAQSDLLI